MRWLQSQTASPLLPEAGRAGRAMGRGCRVALMLRGTHSQCVGSQPGDCTPVMGRGGEGSEGGSEGKTGEREIKRVEK